MLNLALSMILFGIIVKSISLGSTDGFGIKNIYYLGFSYKGATRLNILSYSFILSLSSICMYVVLKYLNSLDFQPFYFCQHKNEYL